VQAAAFGEEAAGTWQSLPMAGTVLAVVAVGLAARHHGRAGAKRSGLVALNAINGARRGENYQRPNAKGSKPMINRHITQDILRDSMKGWTKKYRTAGDIEDIMKKTIYGRVQFQFASEHFTDDLPWFPVGQSSGGRNPQSEAGDHLEDDPLYVRKYLEPAKFKKLEIANWEMPENYTRSVTLQELVQAGVQYGHSSGIWNPKMLKFLYAENDGTHIFDLVQTAANLNRACYYAMEAASKGATFLFAGTKEQASKLVKQSAKRTGQHYCDTRFVGGLLTNFNQVAKGVALMKKLRTDKAQGAWQILSEQEKEKNRLKIGRLIRKYQGVQDMEGLPDIVICIDEMKERNGINECTRIGIPVIGLIDSNNDPTFIDLPIPGNASGSRSIDLVLGKLTEAILKGQELRALTPEGDRDKQDPEWDPWLFSRDRLRYMRRRSKRQPWHKMLYGGYEQWKKANPFGRISPVAPFEKFSWKN